VSTLVIARLTFHEALRRRIVLAALLLGLLFLVVYGVGFHFIDQELRREGSTPLELFGFRTFLTTAGLYVVNFLMVMLTVLTSVDTLSGEVGSGTIHTLAAKPLRRWEIVLGKWLGFAAMLSLYLLLVAGGVIAIVNSASGQFPTGVVPGIPLMWLNVLLLLSVTLLGGTLLSTLANGVTLFGLYAVAFIGGWIEQIGSFFENQTALNIGIISSLLLPSEALWRRAAYEMQPLASVIDIGPFITISVPSPLMIGYAVVYGALALLLAMIVFTRRDL
jgi:ABC-type transport system involved in multi-copper enzyme maturation permease subunit